MYLPIFFEIADGKHGAHRLARLQTDQVADVLAFAGGADVGNFVHLQPVNAAGVGEDQNVGVGGVDEEMLDEILVARLHAGAARASAALHAVGGDRRALHVAAVADRDRDLLVGDQVFQMDFGSFVFDDGAALVAVQLLYFFEFFHDHGAQFLFRTQDGFVLGDVLAGDIQFFRDFVDRELGQAVQLQFENRVGLNSGEGLFRIALGSAAGGVDVDLLAGKIGDQVFAGFGAVGAGADDGDHVVQVIERGQVAFENVFAVFGFREQVGGAAADHIDAVVDEVLDGLHQAHFLGLAVHHRQQDHAEAFLHLGVLEELVEDELGLAVALELDHDAHAVAIAFVADVGNRRRRSCHSPVARCARPGAPC